MRDSYDADVWRWGLHAWQNGTVEHLGQCVQCGASTNMGANLQSEDFAVGQYLQVGAGTSICPLPLQRVRLWDSICREVWVLTVTNMGSLYLQSEDWIFVGG